MFWEDEVAHSSLLPSGWMVDMRRAILPFKDEDNMLGWRDTNMDGFWSLDDIVEQGGIIGQISI